MENSHSELKIKRGALEKKAERLKELLEMERINKYLKRLKTWMPVSPLQLFNKY